MGAEGGAGGAYCVTHHELASSSQTEKHYADRKAAALPKALFLLNFFPPLKSSVISAADYFESPPTCKPRLETFPPPTEASPPPRRTPYRGCHMIPPCTTNLKPNVTNFNARPTCKSCGAAAASPVTHRNVWETDTAPADLNAFLLCAAQRGAHPYTQPLNYNLKVPYCAAFTLPMFSDSDM